MSRRMIWTVAKDGYSASTPEGYTVARYVVDLGGVYVATLAGERIAAERFSDPSGQDAARKACKRACELHAEGSK